MVNIAASREMLAFLKTFNKDSIRLILTKRFAYRRDQLRERHAHDFFEVNYCRAGRTFFEVDGHFREYCPFDFNIIPPGAVHGADPHIENQSESIIIWFEMKADQRKQAIIELCDYRYALAWLCLEIHEQFTRKGKLHEEVALSLMRSMLTVIHQYLVTEGKVDAIDYAINFINDRLKVQDLSVAETASAVNMSVSQFSKKFKERVGVSPRMFIIARRVEEARRLLLNPDLTICSIADSLGYSDAFYFSRQFRVSTGLTPSEFRQLSEERSEPAVRSPRVGRPGRARHPRAGKRAPV